MKKRFLILFIIFCIFTIALIPLNLFWIQMPEWVMPIMACGSILFAVLFFNKGNGHWFSRGFVALVTVFTVFVSLCGSYCNPYWNSVTFQSGADYHSRPVDDKLSSRDALKDLDYAVRYLKKLHPAFYKKTPQGFEEQYKKIKERLKACDEVTVQELSRDIETVFSGIKDGHTFTLGNYSDNRYLKNNIEWEQNGCRLIAVNQKTVEQLLVEKADLYSFDAPSWERENMAFDLISVYGLTYLGFSINDGIEYVYETADGKQETVVCHDKDFIPAEEYQRLGDNREGNAGDEFVRYELDEEKSLAILTLDECIFDDTYTVCLKELFTKVKEKGIKNVAVDLRDNGGGDSQVIDEFIRYLNVDSYHCVTYQQRLGMFKTPLSDDLCENERYEELTFDGALYVFTSADTFSSGMLFAQYIKDNKLGTLIGEAPGNDPNGYGEIAFFKLPRSQLFMQISTKQFYRVDRCAKEEFVIPDISCDSDKALDELDYSISKGQ